MSITYYEIKWISYEGFTLFFKCENSLLKNNELNLFYTYIKAVSKTVNLTCKENKNILEYIFIKNKIQF